MSANVQNKSLSSYRIKTETCSVWKFANAIKIEYFTKIIKGAWKLVEYIILFKDKSISCKHNLYICFSVVGTNLTSLLLGTKWVILIFITRQANSYFFHLLNNFDF